MSTQLTAILVALQFLTICPPVLRRVFEPAELGRAVAYFPLIGAVLGAVLALAGGGLALLFPANVAAALLLVVWVALSGSLHVDGFLDMCDGLFGGFTPDDRLRIMRDESVGGYALSGGLLLFLVKFAALAALAVHASALIPALVVAPVLGRWAMSAAVVLFPYARDKGLGRAMKDHAGRTQLVIATLFAVALAWLLAATLGLVACLVAAVAAWLLIRLTLQRIPGLTGDIYGAVCEVVEVGVLLTFVARAMP